jgi:hypothetical protein
MQFQRFSSFAVSAGPLPLLLDLGTPGKMENRTSPIAFVRENHGTSGVMTKVSDNDVPYSGKRILVTP